MSLPAWISKRRHKRRAAALRKPPPARPKGLHPVNEDRFLLTMCLVMVGIALLWVALEAWW